MGKRLFEYIGQLLGDVSVTPQVVVSRRTSYAEPSDASWSVDVAAGGGRDEHEELARLAWPRLVVSETSLLFMEHMT